MGANRIAEDIAASRDCPHAAPFRYCHECVVQPCPIGLGKPYHKDGIAEVSVMESSQVDHWFRTSLEWQERAIRAETEIELMAAALPGPYYMDPPDGGDVSRAEQMRRMAADAKRSRVLLFAAEEALDFIKGYEDVDDGDYGVPKANDAMRVAQLLREALTEAR